MAGWPHSRNSTCWRIVRDMERLGQSMLWMQMQREGLRGLLDGKDPEFLFNCDETGFLWQATENHGLSTKLIPGMKVDKSRITVLVIINATGTRKIQLFIGNAKQP